MYRKNYSITIAAPREAVWNTLWNDESYRKWAGIFAEGSSAQTDWKKGSPIFFVDQTNAGMYSMVADNKPNEYMGIKHLGLYKNGVKETDTTESKKWEGFENYNLQSKNGNTELSVDLELQELSEEFQKYFEEAWPKAMEKIKELSEGAR